LVIKSNYVLFKLLVPRLKASFSFLETVCFIAQCMVRVTALHTYALWLSNLQQTKWKC